MTHVELVHRAGKWLKSIGCTAVMTELSAATMHGETPDAIGWYNGNSIIVECKTSRRDFITDQKKPFRMVPEKGVGSHRLYLCPEDMIAASELPEGWGLLYASAEGMDIQRIVCPEGNCSWGNGTFKNKRCMDSEIRILLSFVRRNKIKDSYVSADSRRI
jgi:hypothetical protein